ncbi:MAG: dCMP deaminase, partial [Candidatus Omnitrophica bacterium]|nr:dCMP deaminase [Candidatus Omnitrophota bacterium]
DVHCEDSECLVIDDHCVRTVHAEMNALIQAAKRGHSIEGATAYVTNMPCTTCAKALITAGIERVVVFSEYHDTLATDFFAKAGVTIDKQAIPSKEIAYDLKDYSSAR